MHVRLAEPQLQQLHVTNLPEDAESRTGVSIYFAISDPTCSKYQHFLSAFSRALVRSYLAVL